VIATNSSRILVLSLTDEPRYRAPTPSINSLRVVMLTRLFTCCAPAGPSDGVADYVRQQVSTGSKKAESMRPRPR
jgi:hypothetical protein